jgi:hypothetical protein
MLVLSTVLISGVGKGGEGLFELLILGFCCLVFGAMYLYNC